MSDVSFTDFQPGRIDPDQMNRQGWSEVRYGPTDDKLIVIFYRKSVFNESKSKEQGKRICENVDFVKIYTPGENLNVIDRPATDLEKQRWPRQWAQFQQNKKQIPDGIPLDLLFPDKPNVADMLKGYNIHTVEQLAHLSAHGIGTIGMGAQDWVNAAHKYLEHAQKGVDHHKFESALKEKDKEIAGLHRQLRDLSAIVQKLNSNSNPVPRQTPQYDEQTSLINNTREPEQVPDTVSFSRDFTIQDLSNEVLGAPASQPKRRGRPPGTRKQEI